MTNIGRVTTWLAVYAAILVLIVSLSDLLGAGQEFVW